MSGASKAASKKKSTSLVCGQNIGKTHGLTCRIERNSGSWIVNRVGEVQFRASEEYQQALEAARDDEVATGEAGRKYHECVQDLRGILSKVNYTIGMPLTGFKRYTSSNSSADPSRSHRCDLQSKMLAAKPSVHQLAIFEAQDKAESELRSESAPLSNPFDILGQLAHPRFRDKETFIGHYREGKQNRDEVRIALRGNPRLPGEEQWITVLRDRIKFYAQNNNWNPYKFGFVCYRLTYGQTDEEWALFMEKFEADSKDSGQWIDGYDNIAQDACVHFLDGREFDIAEGDVEAARRHFRSTFTMLPSLGRMWTLDFLVDDKQSFLSYAQRRQEEIRPPPPYGPGLSSNGGQVRLVDTGYEQTPQELISETQPGYKGEMKVLSILLFEEIYPLLATLSLRPLALWPSVRLHPKEVYVGTTDSAQENWWEFNKIDTVVRQQHKSKI